ncbi:hypothetical protein FRB94_005374 [Tulasnella sp. JGI-2019a]|nr:hypothetical protein FRB94_005374 [Tulasnella sp. JGI-2019a]KAG9004479.1 hypothetical protein FRB93_010256 [Tulasnella sp. JGI-2019a]KAG9027950.1 hypothetical protein FRB95_007027 [Tulasnella sp. JGI-2019a]
MLCSVSALVLVFTSLVTAHPAADAKPSGSVTINHDDPLIFYHGRWTNEPSSWWDGTGIKLYVQGLTSLTLNVGEATSAPVAPIGLSIDYSPYVSLNISTGVNVLPIPAATTSNGGKKTSVVRILAEDGSNNRIQIDSLVLNAGAKLLPYEPSKLHFQFIGDSLTAGYMDPHGVVDSWAVLIGESFKAEYNINAMSGICLTDQPCFGNARGLSFQYFRTEDTEYYYTTDHNYTTPWNFKKDLTPTHIWITIGANDASYNVTSSAFEEIYATFLTNVRKLYPTQPIFIDKPWAWPHPDGTFGYFYPDAYKNVVAKRNAAGDKHIYLIDMTGWLDFSDVFPDNQHPTPEGHVKVAAQMTTWLENWGLKPLANWATLP